MEGNHLFLHGTIEITIFHGTMYSPPFLCDCLTLSAKEMPAYVTVKMDNKKVASTTHKEDRIWNQTFKILCAHLSNLIITITMKTKRGLLGKIAIPALQILEGKTNPIDGFFALNTKNDKEIPKLRLRFMLWFKHALLEPNWGALINNGGFEGVKNASFQQRSNCSVKLYQDAHHCATFDPPWGKLPGKLWEDVYKAIEDAKYLIYIVGWSFNPTMVLVRDTETSLPYARGVQLGDLLKKKAEEGVAVRIMLWDDETSLPIIKNKGMMKTNDESAFAYFKHTKVICKLCPRLHHKFPTVFAHHQKTITVDTRTQISSMNREITSFIGGLDLCDGRYDTPEHSLFKTLNTEANFHDFYQMSIPGACLNKGGPREPWHDTHACITGEAANDILKNFEERWKKQCNPLLLVQISTIPDLCDRPTTSPCDQRDWNVQVFRSIDNVSSTFGETSTLDEAILVPFLSATQLRGNYKTEASIHEGYVEAIRRAEKYIYIENQYFIGGCHLWERDQHCGCINLIPIEIALKIASKIRANERFAAYIVIPMWPEGVPESETVQDILHWTRETMKMMYKLIGEAIRERGNNDHPKDYLNFFCLANRENIGKCEYIPPYPPCSDTQYQYSQRNRRFMIYVHSKVMIVDDIYMLIGSANINQRSMDGQRDTEIAIGCYQVRNDDKLTAGDIHMYRMSLWYEHTGQYEDTFKEPHTLECVSKICSIGDYMWEIYKGDEIIDMGSVHLVSYPIRVTSDGTINELEEKMCNFPDTRSSIKGRRSKILPPIATT